MIAHEVGERERERPARIDDAKLGARIDPRLHAPSVAGRWQPAWRGVTVASAVRGLRVSAVTAGPGVAPVPRRCAPVARRRAVALALLLVAALLAAALAGPQHAGAQAPAVPTPAPTPVEVRVMTFNIWLGGDVVDFAKVIDAITAARADIVGLQEAEGNTQRIAEALHWPYWSDRLHVVSRFPLIDPPEAHGEYVLAQVRPGQVFALANEHLTSDPYGPYLVRSGQSLAQVLANERATRVPEINAAVAAIRPALRRGVPTFMTGDSNTPSALDWTPAVDAVRADVHYPVPWPVTRAIVRAGFTDTYRAVHPDPVATPGITWTFGYPFPRRAANEVIDRIDFVQASRGVAGRRQRDRRPVRDARRHLPGRPVSLRPPRRRLRRPLHARRPGAVRVGARPARRARRPDPGSLRRPARRGDRHAADRARGWPRARRAHDPSAAGGELLRRGPFGSGDLRPGRYDALLVTRGDRVLSRSTFWVVRRTRAPRCAARGRVRAGRADPGVVEQRARARRDWVGIWKAGDTDLYNDYLTFVYTGATVAGATTIAGDAKTFPPGRYVVRLLQDDGYGELARSSFTVTPVSGPRG